MLSIIFIGAENSGNIGAVARVMGNFGLSELILVEPKASHLNKEAIARARHSESILRKAIVAKKDILDSFSIRIAATAKKARQSNITRSAIRLKSLPGMLYRLPEKAGKKIALMLGRESKGLTNEELEKAELIVGIECPGKHKTLNVSHAAAIIIYELCTAYSAKSYRQLIYGKDRLKAEKEKSSGYEACYKGPVKSAAIFNAIAALKELGLEKAKERSYAIALKRVLNRNTTSQEARLIASFFRKLGRKKYSK